jgi:hypothetical protein
MKKRKFTFLFEITFCRCSFLLRYRYVYIFDIYVILLFYTHIPHNLKKKNVDPYIVHGQYSNDLCAKR